MFTTRLSPTPLSTKKQRGGDTARKKERKSERASGRGSADERLNANANDEGEGERERGALSCTQTGSHITIN